MKKSVGFTVIEVIIAVAVIVIIGVIAWSKMKAGADITISTSSGSPLAIGNVQLLDKTGNPYNGSGIKPGDHVYVTYNVISSATATGGSSTVFVNSYTNSSKNTFWAAKQVSNTTAGGKTTIKYRSDITTPADQTPTQMYYITIQAVNSTSSASYPAGSPFFYTDPSAL